MMPRSTIFALVLLAAAGLSAARAQDRLPYPDAGTQSGPVDMQGAPGVDPYPDPANVPDTVSKRHVADGECRDYNAEHMIAARVAARLDEFHTLYVLPCFLGAYNSVERVWITDSRNPGEAQRSLFAGYSDERGWYGKDVLINPEYDPATKTLSAYEKGRGLGDCGSVPLYRWQGDFWQLVEYRYWGECDGSRMPEKWPVIFPPAGRKKK